MADKTQQEQVQTTTAEPELVPRPSAWQRARSSRLSLLPVLGLTALVLLLGVAFTAGSWARHDSVAFGQHGAQQFDRDFMAGPHGMMGARGGMQDETGMDSTDRIAGVVTAVNGDTITVAGNGKTSKVTVTSTTTYGGAAKPAVVNDSILAFGTTSGDTFTATSVRLSRQ